jgi:glyoxylase-like metal-dependent hydrolase (beta-lactamase superfamily II)/ferredoxin
MRRGSRLSVMADRRRAHPEDRGGAWFADTTCIACDIARLLAPGLIAEDARGLSYFTREPSTEEERRQAWRAMLACPSASIGGEKPPPDVFPWELTPGVWMLGYNARESFGATSWLLVRPDGNVMVDAPRWAPALAERIAAMGGVAHVFLTHRDDVADYDKYAARFGASVHIHEADRDAAPDAQVFSEELDLAPGLGILATPGHTRGSAMLLADGRWLFTGDSLEWNRETQDLEAFEDFTWYSWAEQKRSLARLAERARFEWVFPGHGGWGRADDMTRRLLALVDRM